MVSLGKTRRVIVFIHQTGWFHPKNDWLLVGQVWSVQAQSVHSIKWIQMVGHTFRIENDYVMGCSKDTQNDQRCHCSTLLSQTSTFFRRPSASS